MNDRPDRNSSTGNCPRVGAQIAHPCPVCGATAASACRLSAVYQPAQNTLTAPSPEWWNGHRTGFVKGLEEARQKAIDMAKELGPPASSGLRLLANDLWELQQQ